MAKVNDLFKQAQDDGDLSQAAITSLQAIDLGDRIQDAMGISADDFEESEAFLYTPVIDDSSSIRMGGNSTAIRDGYNSSLDALDGSSSRSQVQVASHQLNSGLLHGYVGLDQAARLDTSNYNPNGGTPLNGRTLEVLAGIVAKEQEYKNQGIPVRTVTAILSDGGATDDYLVPASAVAVVVKDLLKLENHIVMAVGVDDSYTDFVKVFMEMGIPKEWILTPGNSEHEIRQAFGVISRASLAASQGAAAFSQTMAGGFGAMP